MSIRTPRSTEKSRHIPVQAWSVTLGAPIRVESGVEHDLVRELDRASNGAGYRSTTWSATIPA